jgi:UDPglucose 6-dehydrogenase
MTQKISDILEGKIDGKKIALLGLAFKGNTDDIRYSPAIAIAKELLKKGAKISATDPEAIANSRREFLQFQNIEFFNDAFDAMKDVDLIVIATEWDDYRDLDLEKIKLATKSKKILDFRNLYDAKKMEDLGFEYFHVGQKK